MRKSMFILTMAICVAAAPVFAQVGIFDQTADWGGPDSLPQRGTYKVAGSASLSGDTYVLQGNGDDIWESNDEGFFLYSELSGSQVLTARVQWVDSGGGNEWAKAGVMIREEGDKAGSRHFWLAFRTGLGDVLGDRTDVQWRDAADAASGNVEIRTADDQPINEQGDGVWLRVTRVAEADMVIGQYSYDGVNWEAAGARTAAFQDAVSYGLAITNHVDNELLAKAEYSDVSIEPALVAVGSRTVAGPTYFNSNSFYKGGDEFTVTIPLTSTFTDAQSVDVTESVPSGWVVSEISDGGVESDGVITWTGISVDQGQSASVSYKVTVPADPELNASFSGSVNGLDIAGSDSMALLGDSLGIFDAHGDIGGVAASGDANYNEDRQEYEVIGSGADIWDNADHFHYAYKEISGAFSMSALIEADPWESANEWVKAGLMIRDDLSTDSPHAFALIRPDYQIDFGWRSEKAAGSSDSGLNSDAYGEFEVEKIGNTINLYYYADSTGEKTLGKTLTIPMEDPVYIGLAVTSHSDGDLSAGYFMDVELTEYNGYAVRELASNVLPYGGGTVAGNKVTAFITPGQTSSDTLTEELPAGFSAENIVVANGEATLSGSTISWKLDSLADQAEMTYDLVVPDSADTTQAAQFGGSFAGLSIAGDNGMYPVFFEIPFVDQVVTLDGVMEEGEYEGAYTETFDHADKTPPGVHWSPDGAEADSESENATFHIFHNNDYIFVAVDVVDNIGLDFESGLPDIWKNDSTELHFDGNLSRSNPKENNSYGFQACVLGSGELVGGNDGPTMVELPNGGYASTDGAYWNAGAKVKDTEDGYIVEYAIDKSQILDPVDRTVIGFEILMNSGAGTGDRTAKWGYWNTSFGSSETDAEYWDNEQGWAIVELAGGGGTSVPDWSLF